MADAFRVLIDKTGALFRAEGDLGVIRGRLPEQIRHGSIYSIFPESGHALIARILDNVSRNSEGRISDIAVLTASGAEKLFHMSVKPDGAALWWFAFVASDTAPPQPQPDEAPREPTVIWVDFFDSVSYLIDQAPADRPIELMMLRFEALADPGLGDRIGADGVDTVRAAIESTLNNRALNGQVGRLDDNSYTIVSDGDTEAEEIVVDVAAATREFGVDADALGARTRTVTLDKGVDEDQLQGAMSHIRRAFLADDDDDAESLIGGDGPISLGGVAAGLEISRSRIVAALDAGDLQLSRYPVVALADGAPALYLVHGQLLIDGDAVEASRKLIMGDFPGLALRHDSAMTREAVRQIAAARDAGAPIDPVVIDVNASSLGEPEFITRLDAALAEHGVAPAAIGFRALALDLTRQSSPSYLGVLELLGRGHPVWLTRFASAVAGATLDGTYTEVTADYLQRLCGSADGRDLVKRLLGVWRDARVHLVAMDVQTEDQSAFVGELGIDYAVGPAALGAG